MTSLPLIAGHYQVLQSLGQGGFGDTFLAQDTHLPSGRKCVVKRLKPMNQDPQIYQLVQERFQREAVLLEQLGQGHPQIPALYAYFEEQGLFYLVQEYVEGSTLGEWIAQQGPQPSAIAQRWLLQTLEILEVVQGRGIIHRDIKPDNIILRATDQKPVLIDFGAVKETMGTQMTQSGRSTGSIVIGTPGFMPVEQGIGRPVFASDLYALGLTFIYVLTGKTPMDLGTDPQTGFIQWSAPMADPLLVQILNQAVHPQAHQRFVDAQGMKAALINTAPPTIALPHLPPTQITPPPSSVSPSAPVAKATLGAIAGGAIVVVLIAGGGWFYRNHRRGDRPRPAAPQTEIAPHPSPKTPEQIAQEQKAAELAHREAELAAKEKALANQAPPAAQGDRVWRSASNLTRIAQLQQICWGGTTLKSVQTVFGYKRHLFSGAIAVSHPQDQGCVPGDRVIGSFDLTGPRGRCTGTVAITWRDQNQALLQWTINNRGPSCPLEIGNWAIVTYPES